MAPLSGLGLGTNRVWASSYGALSAYTLCCFFEATATELRPQATITDFCDTWDLDGNGDIQPEGNVLGTVEPGVSGCWDIDGNGNIMPEESA